jgi:hypothetical protein
MMLTARLAYRFNPMLNPENIKMLDMGSSADVGPFAQLLGRSPLAFNPQLLCSDAHEIPK